MSGKTHQLSDESSGKAALEAANAHVPAHGARPAAALMPADRFQPQPTLEPTPANVQAPKDREPSPGLNSPAQRSWIDTEPRPARTLMLKRDAAADSADGAHGNGGGAASMLPTLATTPAGSGAPVEAGIRSRVEQTTGADLSSARIHTGPESARSSASMNARAYTLGQDIHFGAGQYQPGTPAGQHLIAHELVHTVQQQGADVAPQHKLEVSQPGDATEHEADRIADAVVTGSSSGPAAVTPVRQMVSRKHVQRVQVTYDGDIKDVLPHSFSSSGGKSDDPFASLLSEAMGLPQKKNALMIKIKAQSDAELDTMIQELKQKGKLEELKGALGTELRDLLQLHAQGHGARDYEKLLKKYETTAPQDLQEKTNANLALTTLGDTERRNIVRQVINRKTWQALSTKLGPAFDDFMAADIYDGALKRYEGATVEVQQSERKRGVEFLTSLGDHGLHKLLDLLRAGKSAHMPAISIALGPEFAELLGTKIAEKVVGTFKTSGKQPAVDLINGLSPVEIKAFAKFVVDKKGGENLNTAIGPASHDAAVGAELHGRLGKELEWEFGDSSGKAHVFLQSLSNYELLQLLEQMRATDAGKKHSLDTGGSKGAEIGAIVGGAHYDTYLKRFADGATPSSQEVLDTNAHLGKLHGFELGLLVEKIKAVNKQATLVTKFGDAFKKVYHEGLRGLFDRTSDLTLMYTLIRERFGIEFGKDTGVSGTGKDWDKKGLAQAWDVLERLPPSQVTGNDKLTRFLRYELAENDMLELHDTGASGAHGGDTATVGYTTGAIDSLKNSAANVGDPLLNVNRFDKVARHEVGHAVDAKHGFSDAYCINNASGGNWKKFDDMAALAQKFVDNSPSNPVIKNWPNGPQKAKIIATLGQILGSENTRGAVDNRLDALSQAPNALSGAEIIQVKADGCIEAIRTAMSKNSPWYNHGTGGIPLADGQIYVQSYGDKRPGDWVSYAQDARARSVSMYQFRAPGEWFAEAYATYYEPGANDGKHLGRKEGAKQANGALLDARDSTTKAWFDSHVATV